MGEAFVYSLTAKTASRFGMNFSRSAKLSEGGVVAAYADWCEAKPTRKSRPKMATDEPEKSISIKNGFPTQNHSSFLSCLISFSVVVMSRVLLLVKVTKPVGVPAGFLT